MTKPRNGDRIIDKCINEDCGMFFEQACKVGELCHCRADEGGCGLKFRVFIPDSQFKKEKDEDD